MYALVHLTLNGKILSPVKPQAFEGLDYEELCMYLEGASFGKNGEKLHIYNGISPELGVKAFPNEKLSCLKEKKLEKLLKDAHLVEEFKYKVKTIN